jgi:hypothetical protein
MGTKTGEFVVWKEEFVRSYQLACEPNLYSLVLLNDWQYVSNHVDAYFLHVHTTGCFGFLHEPTVRQLIDSRTIPRPLLLALCASSTRFIRPQGGAVEMTHRAQAWADEAKTLVFQRPHDYDKDILAALILQFYHALATAQFELIRLLTHVAVRMATALGIHRENDQTANDDYDDEIQRESSRRLVWAANASIGSRVEESIADLSSSRVASRFGFRRLRTTLLLAKRAACRL